MQETDLLTDFGQDEMGVREREMVEERWAIHGDDKIVR